jgi:hypothetical protein
MTDETRVWIAQCLCPQRHCICATAGVAESQSEAEAVILGELQEKLAGLIRDGISNPWCGFCGATQAAWRYEVGRTEWRTLEAALPTLREMEAEQAVRAAVYGDIHRTGRPN